MKTLDGFNFDVPPTDSQIVSLAQYHRQQLDDAVFHHEIHLGNFCLGQRKKVKDLVHELPPEQRRHFYLVYDGELRRIADDEDLHPADAESGVSVFAIFLVLVIIATILYLAVIPPIVG